ncbi:thioredoxin domain-containing protein [Corynebacterium suranareeae]|uniref:Thioredoxin domain-containing protein n=1 Tax=Corynebacterium suranareeae TaxID=2506452 RepID=A0A160PRA1_9CORY|nr:tetratricopeptide repeat protein [Corynebacterium suranareeae]BAU95603.1 thioredoxin domain-containing protein [Corynebacterium suranareeae]
MTTPHNFVSGAIDLGEVKARADARQKAHEQGPQSEGVASSIDITMENFENEVLRRSTQVPVVVQIGTPRSPDSEQLKSDLTSLAAASNRQFIFAYVNADTDGPVAQAFGVQGLPTVIAVAAGRPLADFQGGQPAEALKQWTDQVVKAVAGQLEGLPDQGANGEEADEQEPEDPRFDAATDALNRGAFDEAIAVYDSILETEPNNTDAKQARDTAKLLGRLSIVDKSVDVNAAADADPQNVELAFNAADAAVVAGDPEAAFDRLIALMTISSGDQKTQVKDRLLELFGMFETSDPRVLAARGKMASALF